MSLNKEMYGLIHDYYPIQKMISIKKDGKLNYFYFSKNSYKIFKKSMENRSVFIFFEYTDKSKVLKGVEAYQVVSISKIFYQSRQGLKKLYNFDDVKEKLAVQINKTEYKMFMDLELTMPAFNHKEKFIPEIIQIGIVITDIYDNVVNVYSNYVNPTIPITDRCKNFLSINEDDFVDAISYKELYNDYKNLINIYKPTIYVWGGNDIKAFQDSYMIHNIQPIKCKYVDLSRTIKQYYELGDELGLFHALKIFNKVNASQAHHALTDATATKEIFNSFKKEINKEIYLDVKKELLHEKEQ